jgi:steroid delta-isomerase
MPSPEQVTSVIDAYVDGYRRNDKDAVLALFGADAVWHDPVGAPPHVGHEGVGKFWDDAHAMADTIVLEPTYVVVAGDEGVNAVEIFTLDDDGKIVLLKAYWDMAQARPGQ